MDGYFAHQLSQRRPFWVAVRLRRDGFRQRGEGAQLPPPGGEFGTCAAPDRHSHIRSSELLGYLRRPCSDRSRAAVARRSSSVWAVLGRCWSRARAVPAPRSRPVLGRSPCPRCPSVAFVAQAPRPRGSRGSLSGRREHRARHKAAGNQRKDTLPGAAKETADPGTRVALRNRLRSKDHP
jgi:hypothetical protein